jgi:hypothetical protein
MLQARERAAAAAASTPCESLQSPRATPQRCQQNAGQQQESWGGLLWLQAAAGQQQQQGQQQPAATAAPISRCRARSRRVANAVGQGPAGLDG